jgi:hypothetical protein
MRFEDIRKLLLERPFRPFRLRTTNNLVYEIRHPELVGVSRSVLHLAIPAGQSIAGEREVVLALLHIVQYEV